MAVGCAIIDPLVQQQLPIESWGPQALTIGFAGRTNGDSYRVLAAFDDTTISITGTVVTYDENLTPVIFTNTPETVTFTTNSGGFLDIVLEGPAIFQATQPIQVAHFANSATFDGAEGDPCEILLPPTGQYLRTNIVMTPTNITSGIITMSRPGFTINFLNIIAAQSAVTNTRLDGTLLSATNFVAIGASGYYGAQIRVTNGTHTVISSQPVGVEVYGFGDSDAYGYFGGVVR